eukprot:SM002070S06295  [mRNA]  locus=s2070:53:521:+ [translate_table: standard]
MSRPSRCTRSSGTQCTDAYSTTTRARRMLLTCARRWPGTVIRSRWSLSGGQSPPMSSSMI